MYDFFFRGAGCGHKHLRLKDFKVPTIKPTFPDKKILPTCLFLEHAYIFVTNVLELKS